MSAALAQDRVRALSGLDGLSVSDWLRRRHDTAPAAAAPPAQLYPETAIPAAAAPVAELRVARAAPPRSARPSRILPLLSWATGLGLGVWLALPPLLGDRSCPPPGEGALYCQLQHGVLRAVMTVLLVTGACVMLARILSSLPAAIRRWRSHELLPAAPKPTRLDDELLVAATRGYTYAASRRVAWWVWRPRWQQTRG